MDMSAYRDLFISEAREHLKELNDITVLLEHSPAEREQIDALFRHSHSLKGMAASMGYTPMAELAHRMEDLMDRVRKQLFPFTTGCADLILEGADLLAAMVEGIVRGDETLRGSPELVRRLVEYCGEEAPAPVAVIADVPSEPPVREEQVAVTQSLAGNPGEEPISTQTVRIRSTLLDQLVTVTGELVTLKHRLAALAASQESPVLSGAVGELSGLLRELQDRVMMARMMPFGGITDIFSRLVRDLSRKSGKLITLEIVGKEIELDRAVLEEMREPLVHLIRNAVDHGIEPPGARVLAGKQEEGAIRLTAFREKDCVVISVEDDGKGMDPEHLKRTAVARGVLASGAAETLSAAEALMLTCIPGFTTTTEVTELSGRGVGMDAVNALIRSFGGSLAIDAEPGRGCRIMMRIPRSIAIINVLLVVCGPVTVGIPLSRILHLRETNSGEGLTPDARDNLAEGEELPLLLDLHDLLKLPSRPPRRGPQPVLVVEVRGRTVGLLADRICGQQEVFIRPLGRPLSSIGGLAGSALLGEGESLFILDVNNLV